MKTYTHLFQKLCSYGNLRSAYLKARKRKTLKLYVIEFEKSLENNLYALQWELLTHTYAPKPLTIFTVRDPKTRKISASNFRDRVVHHALINIISPIFESRFIHDSYANRKGKGTKVALQRFDFFMRKVSGSGRLVAREREANPVSGFCLKCDIQHYFETIDHEILLSILRERIKDEDILWLVMVILANHKSPNHGKGMPLGNLTSQFFANVYLHKLDMFVKHELQAKFYLRYVDDFMFLSRNKCQLEIWRKSISCFLLDEMKLSLHEGKTRIIPLSAGVPLLGFRVFRHFKLLKESNQNRIWMRLEKFREKLRKGKITKEKILSGFAGWEGYAKMANTYRLRKELRKEVRILLSVL